MEERESLPPPPPPNLEDSGNKNHIKTLQLPDKPGTYVVQVPKDQVYRVPPPQNSSIAESRIKAPPRDAKTSRCSWYCVLFSIIFFALLILLGAVFGGLFSLLLSPTDPEFSIVKFKLVERKPNPKYDVTFHVHNSNSKVGILYKDSGSVSLSLKQRNIASGTYPTLYQDPHVTTSFNVTLEASKPGLPKVVEQSVKNEKEKVSVAFSLSIHFHARMKMGLLRSRKMKFDVTCNVKMDSLAKTTRILSQQCQTKRH
ncbi:hypothetical protein Fmac_007832 [Flemingia macrophylla]|uniref:Late embryogenesis abundant protein LEA-2 subgroup domain-containing protein n=1 Tax=Flemingia macrophylla TaxID=520843 RepID=A0ABD1MVQ0_9FABA